MFDGSRASQARLRRHLFLEADEIHVKAQRGSASAHRVKVGVSHTGREIASPPLT